MQPRTVECTSTVQSYGGVYAVAHKLQVRCCFFSNIWPCISNKNFTFDTHGWLEINQHEKCEILLRHFDSSWVLAADHRAIDASSSMFADFVIAQCCETLRATTKDSDEPAFDITKAICMWLESVQLHCMTERWSSVTMKPPDSIIH